MTAGNSNGARQQFPGRKADVQVSASLGKYLQELRAARRLSQRRLAEKAGVTRMTLYRWETGQTQPRLPELEAVLRALSASATERAWTLRLVSAPRAVARARQEITQRAQLPEAAGPMPSGGDLLRALRRRRGLTQAQVAASLGVHQSSVSGWEQSRAAPPETCWGELCRLLSATPQEQAVLTEQRFFTLPAESETIGPENLEAQLADLRGQMERGEDMLLDLRLLNLEAQCWALAARRPSTRPLLMEVFRLRSRWLWWHGRPQEARAVACRLIDSVAQLPQNPTTAALMADGIHIYTGVLADRGTDAHLRRATRYTARWLPELVSTPGAALLRRDLADYLSMLKENDSAIDLSARMYALAEGLEDADLRYTIRYARASILARSGKGEQALRLLDGAESAIPIRRAVEAITRCVALVTLGERREAQNCLERATATIQMHGLHQLGRSASELGRSL